MKFDPYRPGDWMALSSLGFIILSEFLLAQRKKENSLSAFDPVVFASFLIISFSIWGYMIEESIRELLSG